MRKIRLGTIRNSLIWQFFIIVVILLIVIFMEILISNIRIRNVVRDNTLSSNEKIMQQIDAKLDEFYNSIFNVMTLVSYENTTYNYFSQDSSDRISNYEDMRSVLSNTMMIQEDIAGINLYDTDMNILISEGKRFDYFQKVKMVSEITFSKVFRANSISEEYYLVSYPVYDIKNQNYDKQIGMLVFMMSTTRFSSYLEDAQITENSHLYLLDPQNTIIASEGEISADMLGDSMLQSTDATYATLVNHKDTGWQIVSIIPNNEFTGGMESMRSLIFITYLITILSLGLLIYFSYSIIIRPLHKVDLFVKGSTQNPFDRLDMPGNNEISMLADNLNHMLDEKDTMNEQLRQSQRTLYETELAKKQMQLLAYRNQINPHFLYNTFDCIRAMALYYEVDDIAEITMALSKNFRYAVKGDSTVMIQDEINYIQDYAKIINYRFAGKIQVYIEAEEEVRRLIIIKMILQPIVENAVFHGLEEKMGDGLVRVIISREENNRIKIIISDNGCGMPQQKVDQVLYRMKRHSLRRSGEKDSIGLMNIYQRLILFYGEAMDFTLESTIGEGTTVTIIVADNVRTGGNLANV